MPRYIDAEKTLADAWNALYQEEDEREKKVLQGRNETEIENWLIKERPILQDGFELCQKAIVNAPTADVVEVVRCKDCKHKQGSACDYSAVWVQPNGYCQWGERRDDD